MSPPAAAATSAIAGAHAPLTEHAVMGAIADAGLLAGRLDETIHSVLGQGVPVPHHMPTAITINMEFDCASAVVTDTCPLWVAPNGPHHYQDGDTGDMPDDLVDALERIALVVLHSRDVSNMVVDFVNERNAHDNEQLGTLTVALGLAQSPDVGLPYVARVEL